MCVAVLFVRLFAEISCDHAPGLHTTVGEVKTPLNRLAARQPITMGEEWEPRHRHLKSSSVFKVFMPALFCLIAAKIRNGCAAISLEISFLWNFS